MERTNSRRRNVATPNAREKEPSAKQQLHRDTTQGSRDDSVERYHLRICPSIVGLALLLLTVYFLISTRSFSRLTGLFEAATSGLRQHDAPSGDLAVYLHPEDHIFRSPKTLSFDWHITKGFRLPDGVQKEVYLVNGRFPGETIEARSGDRLIVNVTNALEDEGLAIHWHGLEMRNANDMDGAVGITQRPIETGNSMVYDFIIGDHESGTFWYHGHDKTQRDDGLYGSLVVHKPTQVTNEVLNYEYDREILLMIGDWYHRPSPDVLSWYMNSRSFGNEPVPDSLVINGMGAFDCSRAVPARPVTCLAARERDFPPSLHLDGALKYRLRLINTGSLAGFSLGIDNASLRPIQVDGGCQINGVGAGRIGIIYPGERVDAILQLDSSSHPQELRIEMDDENFKYPNPALNSSQTFSVLASPRRKPVSSAADSQHDYFNLQAAVSSIGNSHLSSVIPSKFVLYTTTMKLARYHNIPMGFINHTSWSPQATPLVLLDRHEYDKNQLCPRLPMVHRNATLAPKLDGWVEVVVNNLDDGGHPFHLHGYSFYVVSVFPRPIPLSDQKPPFTAGGSALYHYNPFITTEEDSPAGIYDLFHPLLKDTVYVPQRGYAVIRFRADNPGIWMFHCHVAVHQGSGMSMSWDVS
jgi:FtsP/CotA-like multicopper oxidase with cupredoxin domain